MTLVRYFSIRDNLQILDVFLYCESGLYGNKIDQ